VPGPRARRSELATPASSERMCEKAARSGADLVFLDLEDACAPLAKEGARATAIGALTGLDWGRTVRAVRINGLETPWCHGDVIDVVTGARDALDVLIVPKVRSARDVWWVDVLLTQLEAKLALEGRIALEVLIEDAEGLANAVDIARASDRLEALIFGAGDLSASLHARVDILPPPDFEATTMEEFMVLGMILTAVPAVNAIPAVVEAPPGIVTYTDLYRTLPRGYAAT